MKFIVGVKIIHIYLHLLITTLNWYCTLESEIYKYFINI